MYKKLLDVLKSVTDRIKNELLLFYVALSIIVAIIPSNEARYIVLGIGVVGLTRIG